MISRLLFKLYGLKNKRIRKALIKLILRVEGGGCYSQTIREIFSYYHLVEIGEFTYGSCFELGAVAANTKIGKYCSFAEGVRVFNGNHPLKHISLHPFFYNPKLGCVESEKITRSHLEIGNDVWVGCNAIITPSVMKVGNGAVLAAGAVVTKDVPDFAIVAGNPAKVVKYRFCEELQEAINKMKWWDKDITALTKDIEKFTREF